MIKILDNLKKSKHLLGLNERNLKYIRVYNSTSAKKIADDKLLTKNLLIRNGIQTPLLIGKIKSFKSLERYNFNNLPESIVLKPKKGFGGEGIIVFFSRDKNGDWVKADKTRYTQKDLKNHIRGILEGNFSLKNQMDVAFFEERVLIHPDFKKYAYRGIPDIRVIVFNKVPVMAQLRLPTKESDGKANLHAGGICVGIDIANGVTTHAIQHDKYIEEHPDTKERLRGIKIPYWNKILEIAVQTQIISKVGYLGVDIVIDKIKGPMVLELNARPGLGIQIANNGSLKERLERVTGLKIATVQRSIQVAKNLFGGEIEEEIEEVSGKQLVGYVEFAKLYNLNQEAVEIKVRNDTGAYWSSIDYDLARKLGYGQALDEFEAFEASHPFTSIKDGRKMKIIAQKEFEDHKYISNIAFIKQATGLDLRPMIKIPFEMSGLKLITTFTVSRREDMIYDAIIGRHALKEFLIDPIQRYMG